MYISQKHISRRMVLRGLGVTLGVPLLDAMVPAGKLWASTSAAKAAGRTQIALLVQRGKTPGRFLAVKIK